MEQVQEIRIHNISGEDLSKKLSDLKTGILNEIKKGFKPAPEEYLTREEVCKLLKISQPTLDRYTKKGILRKYSLVGRILYKRSEVESSLIELT